MPAVPVLQRHGRAAGGLLAAHHRAAERRSRRPRRPGPARPRPAAGRGAAAGRPASTSPRYLSTAQACSVRTAAAARRRAGAASTYTWHSAARECQPVAGRPPTSADGGARARGPQARRAARHRRGLRLHPRAGGLQGPGRAAQPGRLAGHDPQRHGRARGRGLHRPAAHQRRADPDRQGLPAVRRPALVGQAAVAGRAPGDPVLPRRRPRPRRHRRPHGAAAGAADPPGRGRAVPLAVPVERAARRAGAADAPPGCSSC